MKIKGKIRGIFYVLAVVSLSALQVHAFGHIDGAINAVKKAIHA